MNDKTLNASQKLLDKLDDQWLSMFPVSLYNENNWRKMSRARRINLAEKCLKDLDRRREELEEALDAFKEEVQLTSSKDKSPSSGKPAVDLSQMKPGDKCRTVYGHVLEYVGKSTTTHTKYPEEYPYLMREPGVPCSYAYRKDGRWIASTEDLPAENSIYAVVEIMHA